MPLHPDKVEWIVNDQAELGVKVGDGFYFLYKGESLVYTDPNHAGEGEESRPMMWRTVGKREFGECCHPLGQPQSGTPNYHLGDGAADRWAPLPPMPDPYESSLARRRS